MQDSMTYQVIIETMTMGKILSMLSNTLRGEVDK